MSEYINEKLAVYTRFLSGKRCAVLGAGISNIPLIRFLLESGAAVTVRDKKPMEELAKNKGLDLPRLEKSGVRFFTGEDYLDNLYEEVIYKTPGLRADHPKIAEAAARGAIVTSEMEAFLTLCPARMIAVTGSDGKTTTTTITAKLLEEAGHTVYIGGNIGKPLLYETAKMRPEDFAVLELSSFQLHSLDRSRPELLPLPPGSFPDVAVITNVSPNHLDWHTSYEEYADAKKAIFTHMAPGSGKLVTNAANDITARFAKEAAARMLKTTLFSSKADFADADYFADDKAIYKNGVPILPLSAIKLPGRHNVENYMAAMAATDQFVSVDHMKRIAETFGGVEHRLEYVASVNGADFYNSSIDSSPTRTIAAVTSFPAACRKKLVLIMGGYDKHIPYAPVGAPVCNMARAVFLCGETAGKIREAIEHADNFDRTTEIFTCSDFRETISAAAAYAQPGDKVILTPASASFDMFRNFEERGKCFKETVRTLKEAQDGAPQEARRKNT